jgi:two-component system, cell cycle sensor histidine kinase and response regulator CckA
LMSLAMNSREAMPDGGTLRIEAVNTVMRDPASPSSRAVRLTVTDTGSGMAREVAAHAFEPFFTTKGVGQGTGLGLDVSRRIVTERHGGEITIDQRPGETVLRVRLPLRLPASR